MKNKNLKTILSIAFLLSIVNSIAMAQISNVSAASTFTDVPIGACFEYSVEFTTISLGNKTTNENFACKAVATTDSAVIVTERWNLPTVAKNDSLYSHYYISKENIASLKASNPTKNITFGGIEFNTINVTSGVLMTDSAGYDWYVYDTKTGLGLAGYKEEAGKDLITESWLTYYSETCEPKKNDIPGYDTFGIIMVTISTVAIVLIKKNKKIEF